MGTTAVQLVLFEPKSQFSLPNHVCPVVTSQAFREFMAFPRDLYRHDPFWAPPLDQDAFHFFATANPFWKHAEAALFLYKDHGRTLGRVAAILDHLFAQQSGEPVGYFGYFEAVDDADVAGTLLGTATEWLAARGSQRVRGPINGTLENGSAILVDGFDYQPYMHMPYNPPYYPRLMEQLGFHKCRDLVAYLVDLTAPIPSAIVAAAERSATEGFRVRPLNKKMWREELGVMVRLFAEGFTEHWGVSLPPDEDRYYEMEVMTSQIDPALCLIAEFDGRPVGLRWMSGDYAPVLARLRGRLGISGAIKYLWYKRRITRGKSLIMSISKEMRSRGLGSCLNYHAVREMQRRGYTELEYSWIDEENWASRRAGEKLGGRCYKTHRIYERAA